MCLYLKNNSTVRTAQKLLLITVCVLACFIFKAQAQKYTFAHYDIEDGLVQSQVNSISEDASHRLWMGTLGGACRFDGKDFTSFSKENGLLNNFIYTVLCDHKNRIWLGTHMGLACLDGKNLTNYAIPLNIKRTWVTSITEDGTGTIWIIMQNRLFKVIGTTLQDMPVAGAGEYGITNICINTAGILYASVYQQGIFCLKGDKWINTTPLSDQYKNLVIKKVLFDKVDHTKAYVIANNKLFITTGQTLTPYPSAELNKIKSSLLSIQQDLHGDLWIGSSNGVYYIKNKQLVHFDAHNGFTDIAIPDIYNDRDGNLWLATWGGGIYKYEGDAYVVFDQSQGISNFQTIMGVVRDKQHRIWLATDGGGVVQYNGKDFNSIALPTTNPYAKKVQCIYTDKAGNVWIGTSLGGLWKYDGKNYTMVPGSDLRIADALNEDENGTIWMAAPLGCFYYNNNTLQRIDGLNGFTTSVVAIGKDSVLVGTQNGVKLVVNKKLVPDFNLKALQSSNIFCMLNYHNKIMFGTGDWGLFIWDKKTGSIKNYNMTNGFNSNSIYNLIADKNGVVWAGTGRGANRILPLANGGFTITGTGNSKDIIAEANENSILYADGKVWMGTTKGLVVYNTDSTTTSAAKPFITIQSVNLLTEKSIKQITDTSETDIAYDQNHLAITFLGVYLKNPNDVLYQYKLIGHDDRFCLPVKNNIVDYPSLPPGKYVFQVKALTAAGLQSGNTAQFSFQIVPPYYQNWIFRVLLLISFVLLGISLQTYMHKRKLRAVRLIEQMKRDEKQKIRQQTAEDFHDDLGNKLTRITVLSDILTAKLENGKDEQKNLIGQIKQNAEALYNGTKDILWALDPKSDNLYEILNHIRLFGIEFFHDTTIGFNFTEIEPQLNRVKLPLEYCRNMTMIFKELLNNILKHSAASEVNLTVSAIINQQMTIVLTDNGKGFNTTNTTGHGINNIKNRAARLGSAITIQSIQDEGTTVTLILKLKNN
jgi:ligand-binding sensor domain-containing protein/signal transduction histidine kinase